MLVVLVLVLVVVVVVGVVVVVVAVVVVVVLLLLLLLVVVVVAAAAAVVSCQVLDLEHLSRSCVCHCVAPQQVTRSYGLYGENSLTAEQAKKKEVRRVCVFVCVLLSVCVFREC